MTHRQLSQGQLHLLVLELLLVLVWELLAPVLGLVCCCPYCCGCCCCWYWCC